MKNQISILIILMLPLFGISQTWNLLGPDTANISRVDFTVALQYHVLCADDGFYLYHYGNNTYEYFTYGGLPVTGAAYFDNEKIMLTMGNGSYSDGIYTFDLGTHEFEVVEYLVWPMFLYYDELIPEDYWVGSEWGGMYRSADGMAWDTVHYFDTINCNIMQGFENHMVVYGTSYSGIYFSNDQGNTWEKSPYYLFFSDFAYHSNGMLYSILPSYSNSSGVWRSDDYGWNWQAEYYYQQLNSICVDVFSQIMVGHDEDGVAMYTPGQYELTFINGDLPCLNINNIQVNPTMSAPAIFVSTDEGVYYSYDYYVGVEELSEKHSPLSISPNPAQTVVVINTEYEMNSIEVFDIKGILWNNFPVSGKEHQFQISELKRGVYFVQVETEKGSFTGKFVKE